ncbi:hypothetical protein J2Z34_002152 [Youngiibacter multivorans]|jgi:hypothetical protein|uniref:Uncharacterized protein n=1 Tax=Youngiibacter multivorans TaxID=937251 RepID=A0ABS4G531_9CLOT|nr:hypothetical protein [Youngiibacter multivorans]
MKNRSKLIRYITIGIAIAMVASVVASLVY